MNDDYKRGYRDAQLEHRKRGANRDAIRNAALEEAAILCDERSKQTVQHVYAESCAKAIRALKREGKC